MINIERHIEETFSTNIKTFIGDRQWDVGYCQVKIFGRYAEFINWLIYDDVLDYIVQGWREVSIEDAALALRKQIYQKTGKRIWALEFRLFPNGEFDIEYNFEPPRGYIEQDGFDFEASLNEQTEPVPVTVEDLAVASADLTQLYQNCREALQSKAQLEASLWGKNSIDPETLDLTQSRVHIHLGDQQRTLAINIVGTFLPSVQTWQWGWQHPTLALDLQEVAYMVLDYGQSHAIQQLQQPLLRCNEEDAWNFTALAVDLAAADGAYCVKHGDLWTYVVFLYLDEQHDWGAAS